eukprot:gene9097-6390_t
MEKESGSPSGRGFFFGALQKVSTPAQPAPTPVTGSLTTTSPSSSAAPTVPAYPAQPPKPLQHTAEPLKHPHVEPGTKQVSGGGGGCYAQKMGYRQCLELNPDDRVNCTWALDNYLKCTEESKMR